MCPRLIKNLKEIGGVVNTAIIIGAANGIIGAQNCGLLVENGGHISITKGWILHRMNYVKRQGSNAGKISVSSFNEYRDVFLADVQAEVVMRDILKDFIFNWDQTAIQLAPTGDWTMNEAKAKRVVIADSDDTLLFLLLQLVNICLCNSFTKERQEVATQKCDAWDVWH